MPINMFDAAPDRVEVVGGNIYYHFSDSDVIYGQSINAALHTAHAVLTAVDEWTRDLAVEVLPSGKKPDH